MKLASLCYGALQLSGVTAVARRFSSRAPVLCYHNVIDDSDARSRDDLGVHMPFTGFERQMRWLGKNYDVVPLAKLVDRVASGESLRGFASVTFDDAYQGVFDHAWPLLRDLSIPATVFVVAAAPGRDDSFWWDDPDVRRAFSPSRLETWLTAMRGDGAAIKETLPRGLASATVVPSSRKSAAWHTIGAAAKEGLQLGAHSMTHRSLPALNEQELAEEVVGSRDIITRRTGVTPEFFAYPYGFWNERVRDAICSAGYRAAFTLSYGEHAVDPWALPRLNVPASIADTAFRAWTAGINLRPFPGRGT